MFSIAEMKQIFNDVDILNPQKSLPELIVSLNLEPAIKLRIVKALEHKQRLPSVSDEEYILDQIITLAMLKIHKRLLEILSNKAPLYVIFEEFMKKYETELTYLYKSMMYLKEAFQCQKTVHFESYHLYFFRVYNITRNLFGRIFATFFKSEVLKYRRLLELKMKMLNLENYYRLRQLRMQKTVVPIEDSNVKLHRPGGAEGWYLDVNDNLSRDYIFGTLKIKKAYAIYPQYDSENRLFFVIEWMNNTKELYHAIAVDDTYDRIYRVISIKEELFMNDERMRYNANDNLNSNIKLFIEDLIFHGDMVLERIGDVGTYATDGVVQDKDIFYYDPNSYFYVPRTKRIYEASFSSHKISGENVKVIRMIHGLILDAPNGAVIEHPEHGKLDLAPGVYRIYKMNDVPVNPNRNNYLD